MSHVETLDNYQYKLFLRRGGSGGYGIMAVSGKSGKSIIMQTTDTVEELSSTLENIYRKYPMTYKYDGFKIVIYHLEIGNPKTVTWEILQELNVEDSWNNIIMDNGICQPLNKVLVNTLGSDFIREVNNVLSMLTNISLKTLYKLDFPETSFHWFWFHDDVDMWKDLYKLRMHYIVKSYEKE